MISGCQRTNAYTTRQTAASRSIFIAGQYHVICPRNAFRIHLPIWVPFRRLHRPDLLVLFTNTVSHKMIRCALDEVGDHTEIVRCHTSSGTALTEILEEKCAVCAV